MVASIHLYETANFSPVCSPRHESAGANSIALTRSDSGDGSWNVSFRKPGIGSAQHESRQRAHASQQTELADVASRLAKFNPTKIAVEALPDRADFATKKFDGFTPDTLTKNPDERAQIAFRLAHQLGQKSVYGIDEDSKTIDYFPFGKVEAYARAHGQAALLARMHAEVEKMVKGMEAAQKTTPIRLMLAEMNEPARALSDHQNFYYALLSIGDQKEQPGAELNAAWYQRNAKIFAKLTLIAKPGDRVLVTFGAGHAFWLRHFIQNTPGFQLVEARDYLR
jgi:hypothetical protein